MSYCEKGVGRPKALLPICGIQHRHLQPSMSNLPEYGCVVACFVTDPNANGPLFDWQIISNQP